MLCVYRSIYDNFETLLMSNSYTINVDAFTIERQRDGILLNMWLFYTWVWECYEFEMMCNYLTSKSSTFIFQPYSNVISQEKSGVWAENSLYFIRFRTYFNRCYVFKFLLNSTICTSACSVSTSTLAYKRTQ